MILILTQGYIIPQPTQAEVDAVAKMVYCRETHDPCDQGCACKADCKRKAEREAKEVT